MRPLISWSRVNSKSKWDWVDGDETDVESSEVVAQTSRQAHYAANNLINYHARLVVCYIFFALFITSLFLSVSFLLSSALRVFTHRVTEVGHCKIGFLCIMWDADFTSVLCCAFAHKFYARNLIPLGQF